MIDIWDDAIYYMEQPMYNQSVPMYCYTNKILHQNKVVVTMAGDMGDEILGGYPKYWKMKKPEFLHRHIQQSKIKTWEHVVSLWMNRIKRPLMLDQIGASMPKEEVKQELLKLYTDDLFDENDPVNSYMALDCVTQVPEEFFGRNDKFGMAYGMEGRFPLATKMFMKYCLNIPSEYKIGQFKNQTKLLTKKAYKGILPAQVLNKPKTGWTVPIGYWLTLNKDQKITDFYKKKTKEKSTLNIIKASQKAGKALLPSWIINDWMKQYEIQSNNNI